MSTYVEINKIQYPATIAGKIYDEDWNGRESKAITLNMSYEDASTIFVDDIEWKIIQDHNELVDIVDEETGYIVQELRNIPYEFDNSDYCIAGDIIDHRDGKVTVKMGKPTAEELLNMIVEGLSL
jgi:hypothetical protein